MESVSCTNRDNTVFLSLVPARVLPFGGGEEKSCPICQQCPVRHGQVSEQPPVVLGKWVCARVNKQVLRMLAVECAPPWVCVSYFYLMVF